MNPWQSLRAEILGALRSLRYDVAANRARRRMNSDTVLLPIITERKGKSRTVFAAGAALLPLAGFGGYLVMSSGIGALVPEAGTPNALPQVTVPPAEPGPQPAVTSAAPVQWEPVLSPAGAKSTGAPKPPRTPSFSPSFAPPVPTPAPTATCYPTPQPTPSQNPSPDPTPTPSATSSATP